MLKKKDIEQEMGDKYLYRRKIKYRGNENS